MAIFRYLSHPQVKIDPDVPVPQWGLSDIGRARTLDVRNTADLQNTRLIISSAETKAVETATMFAEALQLEITLCPLTHENDRSATGYLHGIEFEKAADQFFANPMESFKGWERAVDAQARIVVETKQVLADWKIGDILMIGHGGVGTLLYCHFANLPIQRIRDQPAGGGNYWKMNLPETKMLHGWQAMEKL
jgi:broad specificity phosphatase PhoE